jgi:MFS family permease
LVILPSSAVRPKRPRHDWLGLRVAIWRPRILILLAMVAAVTIADDPVLVLGPALAHQVLDASGAWPGYFISALGLGTVLGSLLPVRTATSRRTACSLLVLALSVVIFASGVTAWLSLLMAVVAGVAALMTGASSQALLLKAAGKRYVTEIMGLWAIAWAGSKPLASLSDGWLASHLGVFHAAMLLAAPALTLALLEIFLPKSVTDKIRKFAYAHNGSAG